MPPTRRRSDPAALDRIRRALAARPPASLPAPLPRSAAVALVLRPGDEGPAALFIRRAEHPDDTWSGHVALPGGRAEPGEASVDTAVRETAEEVGLDLARLGELVGGLDELQAIGRGGAMGLSIRPWVFALRDPPPPLTLSEEVASAHWIALDELLDPARRAPYPYVHQGVELVLPSIRVAGLTVWGLTYQMVELFRAVLESGGSEGT
jgi:8-oxo-dGTP pyrophosphatase MutT (NUDIX family)